MYFALRPTIVKHERFRSHVSFIQLQRSVHTPLKEHFRFSQRNDTALCRVTFFRKYILCFVFLHVFLLQD